MAMIVTEELISIVAQPLLLFVFSILIWSLQSFFITGISRRFIFPSFYRNSVTTYLVAQLSIILHEASHFLSAIFTGSSIIGEETFVTPTHGRVTAASEDSVFGWFSRLIAALAPSFIPPILFLIVFFLVSGQMPQLITTFTYPQTLTAFQNSLSMKFSEVLVPDLILFINSITDFTNPMTFLFIYLLIICSIAAGPSEGDWNSTFQLFISPIPIVTLLALFLFFNFAFSQLNISFVIPLILLVLFVFAVVAIGVFFSFLLAQLILISYKRIGFAIGIMALFFTLYYLTYYFVQNSIISFFTALAPSMALGFMIKSDMLKSANAGRNSRARKAF